MSRQGHARHQDRQAHWGRTGLDRPAVHSPVVHSLAGRVVADHVVVVEGKESDRDCHVQRSNPGCGLDSGRKWAVGGRRIRAAGERCSHHPAGTASVTVEGSRLAAAVEEDISICQMTPSSKTIIIWVLTSGA